jgi:hypothetical protein
MGRWLRNSLEGMFARKKAELFPWKNISRCLNPGFASMLRPLRAERGPQRIDCLSSCFKSLLQSAIFDLPGPPTKKTGRRTGSTMRLVDRSTRKQMGA